MQAFKPLNKYYAVLDNNKYYIVDPINILTFQSVTYGWRLNNRGLMRSFDNIYTQGGQQAPSNYAGKVSLSYDRGANWTLYESTLPNDKTLSGDPVNVSCIKDANGNNCIVVSTDDYDTYVFDSTFTNLIGTVSDGSWVHELLWTWNPSLISQGDFWIRGNYVKPSHVNLSTYVKTQIFDPTGTTSYWPCCRYADVMTPKYYYMNDSIIYESTSAEGTYTQSSIQPPTTTNFRSLIGFKGKLLYICLDKIYYLDSNNNWKRCKIDGINMSTVTKMNLDANHNNDIFAIAVITNGSLGCKILSTLDGISWYFNDFTSQVPAIRDDSYNVNCGKIYDSNKVDLCITNSYGSGSYYNFIINCTINT